MEMVFVLENEFFSCLRAPEAADLHSQLKFLSPSSYGPS